MRLVQDEEELLGRIGLKIGARLGEDPALERAQQHVFEHRIVSDKEIGARLLDLVPGQQLGIVGVLVGAQWMAGSVLPVLAGLAVPVSEPVMSAEEAIGFAWPAPFLAQHLDQLRVLLAAAPRRVFDSEVVVERLQPLLVALAVPKARIKRAPGVAAELGRSPARVFERLTYRD